MACVLSMPQQRRAKQGGQMGRRLVINLALIGAGAIGKIHAANLASMRRLILPPFAIAMPYPPMLWPLSTELPPFIRP